MLTNADIAKIIAVVATKDDLKRLEHRFDALEGTLNQLTTAIQKLAGNVEDLRLEYAAVSTQLSRHEEWIKKLAEKAGVKLEF